MAKQVLIELKQLCFARVARVVAKKEHVSASGRVTTYHGYAIPIFETPKRMIWFQLSSHLRRPIAIGPVHWDVRPPTLARLVPRVGDVIFGQHTAQRGKATEATKNKEGQLFRWWSSQGEPLLEFVRVLLYRSRTPRFDRLLYFRHRPCFHCRRCHHPKYPRQYDDHTDHADSQPCYVCGCIMLEACRCPPKRTFWPCHDLWVVYQILCHGNYRSLTKALSHPKHNYQDSQPNNSTVQGLHLSHDPLRFVFLLAWFARDPKILSRFEHIVRKSKDIFYEETEVNLVEFSSKTLQKLLL